MLGQNCEQYQPCGGAAVRNQRRGTIAYFVNEISRSQINAKLNNKIYRYQHGDF